MSEMVTPIKPVTLTASERVKLRSLGFGNRQRKVKELRTSNLAKKMDLERVSSQIDGLNRFLNENPQIAETMMKYRSKPLKPLSPDSKPKTFEGYDITIEDLRKEMEKGFTIEQLERRFLMADKAGVTVAVDKTRKTSKPSKVKTVAIKDQGEAGRRAQAMAQPNITPMNVETRDSLHRGLVGMADRVQAPPWLQDKIVLMDPDKLKEIYYENPQFFEVVFDYEDITYDEHFGGWLVGGYEMERIENFVRMYELRYGEI